MAKPIPDRRVHLRSATSPHRDMAVCRSPRKGQKFSTDPDEVDCKGCCRSQAWQALKMAQRGTR